MITALIAKLPMRDKETTKGFYCEKLGFQEWGNMSYSHYLMLVKEGLELHLFEFKELDVLDNYGQLYIRCRDIDQLYKSYQESGVEIHPNGSLQMKPWGVKEFSLLDPDHNLLTFGERL